MLLNTPTNKLQQQANQASKLQPQTPKPSKITSQEQDANNPNTTGFKAHLDNIRSRDTETHTRLEGVQNTSIAKTPSRNISQNLPTLPKKPGTPEFKLPKLPKRPF